MNAKNLPLKFAFVVLLVAISLWGLYSRGLRQGIDLRGGHSLIYEFEDDPGNPNLVNEIISTLKNRVDPQGLRSLEWRPMGKNRFEVRMPAGRPESREAKKAYTQALERLVDLSIDDNEIRQVTAAAAGPRRDEIIARLAGGDEGLRTLLTELGRAADAAERRIEAAGQAVEQAQQTRKKAQDRLRAAEAALAATPTQPADNPARTKALAEREAARKALAAADRARNKAEENLKGARLAAGADYRRAELKLRATSISAEAVTSVLGNYVSRSEAAALRETEAGEREVARRRALYDEGLEELGQRNPARKALVDEVARLHREWAEMRQLLDDPSDLKRLIARAGVLEFRIAPFTPYRSAEFFPSERELEPYVRALRERGPSALKPTESYLWFPIQGDPDRLAGQNLIVEEGPAGRKYVLLSNRRADTMLQEPGAGGWELDKAYVSSDDYGAPAVGFTFKEKGARLFAQLTTRHKPTEDRPGHALAILLDGEVYSAPVIREVITDRGVITGDFTPEQVGELVRTLSAGRLKARLNRKPVSENTFGPSLGEENRRKGIATAKVAMIAVAVFMLLYYLRAGFIADIALVLNIVLVLGAMSLLNAVFTLPGIAGLILTIGIAVDANVLIFERLREEQQKGQSIRMALKNAYQRAFTAIFDANLTTLMTCLILGWVGTEEIRGFAITLGLGVVISMFTALVVTRWVFQLLLDAGLMKKPTFMLQIIGTPKINWIRKRRMFWVVSLALIVFGVAALAGQGGDIWGIEFSSGTQTMVRFRDDALIQGELPNDGNVGEALRRKAAELGSEKLAATARVETVEDPAKVERFLEQHDANGDKTVTAEEFKGRKEYFTRLAAAIDATGDGSLSAEELADRPTPVYQVSTTQTDVERIRDVFSAAFGPIMVSRAKLEHEVLRGEEVPALGVRVASGSGGATEITTAAADGAMPAYRDSLLKFKDGVLFVVRLSDPARATTPGEIEERIEQLREEFRRTDVLGLEPGAEPGTFTTFAVLVDRGEAEGEGRTAAFEDFAAAELERLHDALHLDEATHTQTFDAALAGEQAQLAIVALVLSWAAIVIYLWFRFGSAQWGLAAVICLIHDVIVVVGLVAISGWLYKTVVGQAMLLEPFKIDLAMVAAFLTVIGYSVNDTIVVFDRIRENRGKLTTVSEQVINRSVNQTLSRTLLTSGTTFIVVFIMYVWGGRGIHAFNYALLAGIIFGTYSSVAVASPLLLGFRKALLSKAAATATQ
jgi:SecD/SecF fusion protein